MTMRKVPIAAARVSGRVLAAGLRYGLQGGAAAAFSQALAQYSQRRHAVLVNSGICAIYLMLRALAQNSSRREVILPAYTAGSLAIAVRQAGLKPVLCDMDLRSGGMDSGELRHEVNTKTLAIIGVHLFGLVENGLAAWKKDFPGVFILEDACQAMGSTWQGEPLGRWGDASVFSFNKGKNMPLVNGGVIVTDDDDLASCLRAAVELLPRGRNWLGGTRWLQMLALSIVTRPLVYGLVQGMVGRFRELAPPESIHGVGYTELQSGLGLAMLGHLEQQSQQRYENAMGLMAALRGRKGISLFTISPDSRPGLNRLPILVSHAAAQLRIEQELARQGIETSRFYRKPLHHMFDLGYPPDAFPQANALSDQLLTIPCHPLMTGNDIARILSAIKLA